MPLATVDFLFSRNIIGANYVFLEGECCVPMIGSKTNSAKDPIGEQMLCQ